MSPASPSLLVKIFIILAYHLFPVMAGLGAWHLLQKSVGVSAMHMQLLPNDRIVLFDRTNFGHSNITFPDGRCRHNPDEQAVKEDCTAHSIEYNVISNTFRPLFIFTDTWCSSGTLDSTGKLVQTGGYHDGEKVIRLFQPCATNSFSCDWHELEKQKLINKRWYATNHLLPNGQIIIIGGLDQPNYEFFPKTESTNDLHPLPFLGQSNFNNLYPFVFLNTDGNLFIFGDNRAILLNYKTHQVIRDDYPVMPDGSPRNYPSTGSAVLLPLRDDDLAAEVMICGGAPGHSYKKARDDNEFIPALNTCGRININDPNPTWKMETMPMRRVMSDMILLPNGQVLIINGCELGTAGWGLCRNSRRSPILYNPNETEGSRFVIENRSNISRVYHSTGVLLRDGRVLVGGSNTHFGYVFSNVRFPTLLSLESFSPPYLHSSVAHLKPNITFPPHTEIRHGEDFTITFQVKEGLPLATDLIKVTIIFPPFNTHSFSQGQRMLILAQIGPIITLDQSTFQVTVKSPGSGDLAPAGYYMLFVVNKDVPSGGIWVRIIR